MFPVLLSASLSVAATLCTANPTAQAVEMYNFLASNYGKKMIAGAMTTQGQVPDPYNELNWVHANAGRYPALGGFDFLHQTGKDQEWYFNNADLKHQVTDCAVGWYRRGGIPALCWHWIDPSKQTIGFYSPRGASSGATCNFDAAKAVVAGTAENKAIMADLAVIADQLEVIKKAGAAVLWRPLHEASGGWFWWGYAGPEPLKKLWRIEYDYFVKQRGLNHLIWVFTADDKDTAADWYPGDDVVDVIGVDIYEEGKDHPCEDAAFKKLGTVFGGKKILAFTECGYAPNPTDAQAKAQWSYFMTWYGHYTMGSYNTAAFWKTLLTHPFVISLEQMPGWKAK
jgi:mannan endo-1,4-beta-mannosidase